MSEYVFGEMGFSSFGKFIQAFEKFRDERKKEHANKCSKILDSIAIEDLPIPEELRRRDVRKDDEMNTLGLEKIGNIDVWLGRVDYDKNKHGYILMITRNDVSDNQDLFTETIYPRDFNEAARTYLSVLRHLKAKVK